MRLALRRRKGKSHHRINLLGARRSRQAFCLQGNFRHFNVALPGAFEKRLGSAVCVIWHFDISFETASQNATPSGCRTNSACIRNTVGEQSHTKRGTLFLPNTSASNLI
jgi:hypothetical protein